MKKYIILTPSIVMMGGAEEYVNRKVEYLKKQGIEVFVFSSRRGKVILDFLTEYSSEIITSLGLPPYDYSKRYCNKMIALLKNKILYSTDDEIMIESTATSLCMWGEIFAKSVNAKHICIILQEKHNYPMYFQEYLLFKYNRHELYGINKNSITQMFSLIPGDYEQRYINAPCNDVIRDVDTNVIKKLSKADYNICSIGRLDKNFVIYGVNEVVFFAKNHLDLTFNLVMIGGGEASRVSEIKSIVSKQKNINLIITGYLYPIPAVLMHRMDCFYSSAGSSRVSADLGKPTISMSADGDPLGILYYTTMQTLYKDEEYHYISLSEYLEKVLIEKYCEFNKPIYNKVLFDKDKEFQRELDLFCVSSQKEYYEFKNVVLTLKEKVYKCASSILGGYLFEKIQYAFHRLKGGKDV